MKDFQRLKSQLAEICDQAANGSITIEEFYERWPEELRESAIAKLIYEDLEDGIQHFPAKLLSGKPDYETWKSSEMYQRILVDKETLEADQSEERLLEMRDTLLTKAGLKPS